MRTLKECARFKQIYLLNLCVIRRVGKRDTNSMNAFFFAKASCIRY